MAIALIVAETQPGGGLRKATLNAVTAGKALSEKTGAELHALVLAKDAGSVAQELAGYGVKVVHAASAPHFEHYVAELFAPAVAELAQSLKATWVLAASTAVGKDLLPRAAAKL